MPVYNEKNNVGKIIARVLEVKLPIQKELIVVDDYSTDGTRERLEKLQKKYKFQLFFHEKNKGKGGAIKTALSYATGDFVIFQDADLEYSPEDYPALIKPLIENKADIVLGNRFNNKWSKPHLYDYIHYLGNRFQGFVMSLLYAKWLNDVWTCYKVFKIEVIKSVEIKGDRFDYEIELISKLLKKNVRVANIPIRYHPRNFEEGKKITWKDGIKALIVALKYRFFIR